MNNAIVLNTDDIKKIIAEHFGIDEKQVIKAQYSWIVLGVDSKQNCEITYKKLGKLEGRKNILIERRQAILPSAKASGSLAG